MGKMKGCKPFNNTVIFSTFKPVYYVCLFLGIVPAPINDQFSPKLGKPLQIFKIAVNLTFCIALTYSLYRFTVNFYQTWVARDKKETTQNLVNVCILSVLATSGYSAVYISTCKSQQIVHLFRDLHTLHDMIFPRNGFELYHLLGKKLRHHCIAMTSYIVFLSIYEPTLWPPNFRVVDLIGYSIVRVICVGMELQVHFFFLAIQVMYRGVNIALRVNYSSVRHIERLRRAHSLLCDVREAVNEIYDLFFLFTATASFVISCMGFYYCFVTFFIKLHLMTLESLVQSVIASYSWLLYVIIRLIFLSKWAHEIHVQARQTGIQIQKIDFNTLGSDCVKELKYFSRQILHERTTFTACGFVPLNETLLFTVTGAVTTYLVILLQFQNSIPDS